MENPVMFLEGIHEVSGYLALTLLGLVAASGIWLILQKLFQYPNRNLLLKVHKLSAGLFIAFLLPHTATSGEVNGYFVLGAFLMGLTLAIVYLIPWFPTRRKLILDLKILVFLVGAIVLLVAHLRG